MIFREFLNEKDIKFTALTKAKELHTKLAALTFIDMLSLTSPDNPARKEIQTLETKINDLTTEVGSFIQKYIPDVSDTEEQDNKDDEDDEEPEDDEDTKSDKDLVKDNKDNKNADTEEDSDDEDEV